MNRTDYLSRVISKPWAIDKIWGRTFLRRVALAALKSERPEEDIFGDTLPKMNIIGSAAIIPLWGIIDIDVPDWLKEYGFAITDANDIEKEIQIALNDANVDLLCYDVSSPGGSGLAAEKLYDITLAAEKKKRFISYTGDGRYNCSGAYWPCSACTDNYAGDYAEAIGNVGAWMSLLDDSEFWAQMGIKFEVFRSGEYKGIGEDSLSEEQRAYLQGIVDECGALFRRNVKAKRKLIADEDLQGQWFKGSDAAKRDFVGGIAKDVHAAIANFSRPAKAAA